MLTEHQNEVKEEILDAIFNQGEKHIILRGSAGVGKTFMVQHLIEDIMKKKSGNVYITAPTNKAVAILQEKSDEFEAALYEEYLKTPHANGQFRIRNFEAWKQSRDFKLFKTIHSALYLKRRINDKTGEVSFAPDYNPKKEKPFDGASVVIVDEASMVNSQILYYLEQPQYSKIIFIYLGDDKQLNPVGEAESPIFLRNQLYYQQYEDGIKRPFVQLKIEDKETTHYIPDYTESELTEIIRQGEGNPIIDLSRNVHYVGLKQTKLNPEGYGYTHTRDFEMILNMIIADPYNVRYLGYTNAEVNKVNTIVRQRIFTVPAKLQLGETIVVGEAYQGLTGERYSTNSELPIKTLEVIYDGEFPIEVWYEDWNNPLANSKGMVKEKWSFTINYYLVNDNILVVHESSEAVFYSAMKKLREQTKKGMSWKTWFNFGEQFMRFHYQYALTVHKSQGSTYKTSILNMIDINRNRNVKERQRLWYTAITRAAKNIYIYEPSIATR